MPPFLSGLIAALGGQALKLAGLALGAAALLGAGYVWGDTHASSVAIEASAKAAQAQVAATTASYQATIAAYSSRLKTQTARGDQLAAALNESRAQLTASASAAKEKISHAVPDSRACDIDSAGVELLRAQPARH